MFKNLGEKKQQLDKLLALKKSIQNLEVHSKGVYSEILINSSFEVLDVCINPDGDKIDIVENDLKDTINKGIKKMQELIQSKSKEIYNKKKKA